MKAYVTLLIANILHVCHTYHTDLPPQKDFINHGVIIWKIPTEDLKWLKMLKILFSSIKQNVSYSVSYLNKDKARN